MKIGPKYKIARRLGANIFDKTQTPKFAARMASRGKGGERKGRPKTDYGIQMIEKQKARYMYGINERQFSTYVKRSLAKKSTPAVDTLYEMLESRLDNVIYRMGLASTRQMARQMVSHGHILVDGVKVTVPSYQVSPKEIIAIRDASAKKKLFEGVGEKFKEVAVPPWIKLDLEKRQAVIEAKPAYRTGETVFDINAIIQFYQR
ncbi:MAG: 30S ribosomal protein S4 [Candidatus Taylorbacteria bacterium]